MNKRIFSLLVVLLVFALVGCQTKTAEVTTAPEAAETVALDPYKIGVFLRFSDEAGTKMQATITKAFEDINANGGINGHPVEVIMYDTEGDSAKGIDAFTRLVNDDKVLLVIGPTTSGVALAVIDLAEQYQTVMITPQATNTSITAEYGNEWFFRNSVADLPLIHPL